MVLRHAQRPKEPGGQRGRSLSDTLSSPNRDAQPYTAYDTYHPAPTPFERQSSSASRAQSRDRRTDYRQQSGADLSRTSRYQELGYGTSLSPYSRYQDPYEAQSSYRYTPQDTSGNSQSSGINIYLSRDGSGPSSGITITLSRGGSGPSYPRPMQRSPRLPPRSPCERAMQPSPRHAPRTQNLDNPAPRPRYGPPPSPRYSPPPPPPQIQPRDCDPRAPPSSRRRESTNWVPAKGPYSLDQIENNRNQIRCENCSRQHAPEFCVGPLSDEGYVLCCGICGGKHNHERCPYYVWDFTEQQRHDWDVYVLVTSRQGLAPRKTNIDLSYKMYPDIIRSVCSNVTARRFEMAVRSIDKVARRRAYWKEFDYSRMSSKRLDAIRLPQDIAIPKRLSCCGPPGNKGYGREDLMDIPNDYEWLDGLALFENTNRTRLVTDEVMRQALTEFEARLAQSLWTMGQGVPTQGLVDSLMKARLTRKSDGDINRDTDAKRRKIDTSRTGPPQLHDRVRSGGNRPPLTGRVRPASILKSEDVGRGMANTPTESSRSSRRSEHVSIKRENIGIKREHIGIKQEHIDTKQEHIDIKQEHVSINQGYAGIKQEHIGIKKEPEE